MNVRIYSPRDSLIGEVAGLLSPEGRDYSRQCVIFPGKRPAHFLRKTLAARAGGAVIPPAILSFDEFVESCYRDKTGGTLRRCSVPDAVAVLHDVHTGLGGRLGDSSYDSLDAFLPVGMKLIGELEELALADLPARTLRQVLGDVPVPRFHSLSEYYRLFYDELPQRGLITRSGLYRAVAGQIGTVKFDEYDRIIVAGFYALTNVEQEMFRNLAGREGTILVFQEGPGLVTRLRRYGLFSRDVEVPAPPPLPDDIRTISSPDAHGQVFACAALLREDTGPDRIPDEQTAIVLPSADVLFPVVHFACTGFPEDRYNVALGYPVARTPVYGFLAALMSLAESFHDGAVPPTVYLGFVLHPYTKNIRFGDQPNVTRMMFHALEDYLAGSHAGRLLTLEGLESDTEFFEPCSKQLAPVAPGITADTLRQHLKGIHDMTVRRVLSFGSVSGCAATIIDVLNAIMEHSPAQRHPYAVRYVRRCVALLEEIRDSMLGSRTFNEPAGYFAFLRSMLQAETVPFPGTPLTGLQVVGLLETRNIGFRTLHILDANDDVLPGQPPVNLLLPQQVRTILGLETYHDREQLIEYYLSVAVAGADRVRFYYTESGNKEQSRYVRKLRWQLRKSDPARRSDEGNRSARYRMRLANDRPGAVPKTPGMAAYLRTMRYSASAVDLYHACHLKFYYRYVLGIRERDEASDDLDQAVVGTIVHDVLARYFRQELGRQLNPGSFVRDRLRNTIGEVFAERFGHQLTGSALLMKQQVELHLWDFFERHQIPLVTRNTVVVKAIEKPLETVWHGFRLGGRIDRVEYRNGSEMIIDYKTTREEGSPVRPGKLVPGDPSSWRDAVRSFQLPFYMVLYGGFHAVDPSTVIPAYLALGRNRIDDSIETGIGDDDHTPAEMFGIVGPVLADLLHQISDESVPFQPTPDPERHCPGCPHATSCGMLWVRSWKE